MDKFVVGLSGTHGTGKSTIIQGVKDAGFAVNESQLSRAAQKALGWDSLARVKESVENMWTLQDAILGGMYDRDKDISDSRVLTLVERTPADVWAYTELWCRFFGINPLFDTRARRFKQLCRNASNLYSTVVIVPINSEIKFEHDNHRADLTSRETVEESICGFIWDSGIPNTKVMSTDRSSRTAEVISALTLAKMKLGESNVV